MTLKVVSLLPSATEILTASSPEITNDEILIGRSHECDFPPYVTSRPILTAAKNKFESCAQMNEAVCQSLAAGEGLYSLDTELLKVKISGITLIQHNHKLKASRHLRGRAVSRFSTALALVRRGQEEAT